MIRNLGERLGNGWGAVAELVILTRHHWVRWGRESQVIDLVGASPDICATAEVWGNPRRLYESFFPAAKVVRFRSGPVTRVGRAAWCRRV